ncbi:hypothetical protein JZU61_04265 [bacterium]|jgi:hypothetical protein|nr:hypothetical protein [bacterium]
MAITSNREYMAAALTRFGLTDNDIDMIMVENPGLEEAYLNVSACKEAIYKSFTSILPTADVSDSGYSVTWDIDMVKLYYKALCTELGKPNFMEPATAKPQIRNRSNYW